MTAAIDKGVYLCRIMLQIEAKWKVKESSYFEVSEFNGSRIAFYILACFKHPLHFKSNMQIL